MYMQNIGTDGADAFNALATKNQRNSPLLRLPAEIRNDIFAMVIGGNVIRICFTVQCELCQTKMFDRAAHCPLGLLSLTETCRQIRAETRALPFTLNTFCGYSRDLVSTFDVIFDKTQLETIALLCILVLYKIDFVGFRRLRGLEQVTILSKYAYGRHIGPSNIDEVLTKKFLREIRRNEAIGYVDLKIIETESLRDIGLALPQHPPQAM